MNPQQLARGLGWFSIGLGMMELAAPKQLSRWLGLHNQDNLLRLYGAREIASGLGILSGQATREWVWARVGGDALDLVLLDQALNPDNPRRDSAMLATAAVAGATLLDAYCALQLGEDSGSNTLHLEKSITIDRPAEELYRFWHNFTSLPQIMNHLLSVREIGSNRWHWIAKAPLGRKLEWDAEITDDRPYSHIGWRSLPGADVDNQGTVRFIPAAGGRGTVVTVAMDYRPPAGRLGAKLATLIGESPEQQVAVDLQHFKQIMETGEIADIAGQPTARPRSTSKYESFVHG